MTEHNATYLRIEGVSPDELADTDADDGRDAAHDLADRVFAALESDYPDVYDAHDGVVPVLNPEHDPRLVDEDDVAVSTEAVRTAYEELELLITRTEGDDPDPLVDRTFRARDEFEKVVTELGE